MLNYCKIRIKSALMFLIAGSAIIIMKAQDSGKKVKEVKNIFVVYNTGEDMFVLGADLIDQLKKKRKIMLAHWQDIEGFLATPFK
jgi:hypothetical protein